jgi:hypothetical protein
MDAHRNLAVAAMQAMNAAAAGDFMNQAKIPMPEPIVRPMPGLAGALPAMARETVPAQFLHMLVDVDMVWTIADFDPRYDCSSYYDPSSPWYNVFYGAYGLRSYKPDGTAWGFNPDGTPNFAEFLRVPALDYNFLTAGMFGCPPGMMCFDVRHQVQSSKNGWDAIDVIATAPSGLHEPSASLADPSTYVIYGVPDPSFLAGRTAYECVEMRGLLYLKDMTPVKSPFPQKISLAWGALCPNTAAGNELLSVIIDTMGDQYFRL